MQEDGTKSIQRKTREWETQPKKSRQVVLADNWVGDKEKRGGTEISRFEKRNRQDWENRKM